RGLVPGPSSAGESLWFQEETLLMIDRVTAAGRFRTTASRATWVLLLAAGVVGHRPLPSEACPFCFGSLQLTLREQIENSDASVIIRWEAGDPGDLTRQRQASTR